VHDEFICCSIGAVTACALQALPAAACTGIRLKPGDGSVVYGRTLEFGTDLCSNVIVIPRGKSFVGTTRDNQPGLRWTSHYGAVGANAFGMPALIDGVNEQGLAVGVFYFPGYAKYQTVRSEDVGRALAPWELATFLLVTCADVSQALAAAESIRVDEVVQADFGFVPPCHFVVHDASGRCAVLEYVDGELRTYDNPLGVVTNSPTFDWHVTNLRNYTNLSVTNVPPIEMVGMSLNGFGQGNGLLGLPGDFTPPSRFVRAVAFSQSAVPVRTARDGVLEAFHILNQFDIPKGAVRGTEQGRQTDEYTLWTSAADLANRRYHFHTYASRQIRMVDLSEVDLDATDVKTFSMAAVERIEDVSSEKER
jgi:choloylglycine hydrolase